MNREQDKWDAGERDYKAERDTPIDNRWYTEAFRDGMRAALDMSRELANKCANALPVRQGDAFLAGYYAELRRLRNYEDLER